MKFEISIDPYRVFHSGTIANTTNGIITHSIADLKFNFIFKDDAINANQRMESKASDDKKGLDLTFYNFNSSLGSGISEPLLVANLNSIDVYGTGLSEKLNLYLTYRIYSIGQSAVKTLHYTWLTKEKEKN